MTDVREYVTGFVSAIIAVTIGVSLIPTVMSSIESWGGPLLTTALAGTVIGAGILLFILRTFI